MFVRVIIIVTNLIFIFDRDIIFSFFQSRDYINFYFFVECESAGEPWDPSGESSVSYLSNNNRLLNQNNDNDHAFSPYNAYSYSMDHKFDQIGTYPSPSDSGLCGDDSKEGLKFIFPLFPLFSPFPPLFPPFFSIFFLIVRICSHFLSFYSFRVFLVSR